MAYSDYIIQRLFELEDKSYKEFHCKLMPTVDKGRVIGIRTPKLRSLARELFETEAAEQFVKELPHNYYEENNLHAFLIEKIRDFGDCIKALDEFLPYVDNWATCDMLRPKIFAKNKDGLLIKINEWMNSEHIYTVRFGIEMLMVHFLDEDFKLCYAEAVAETESKDYYIMMMKAWYFATALAKQYDTVLPFIEQKRLDKATHNKAIQKALESFRITENQKKYLRTLKINNQ